MIPPLHAVSFEDSADVMFNMESSQQTPPSLHFTENTRLTITWNPDALVSILDPSSFLVNIVVNRLNLDTGVWERAQDLATNEQNDGQAVVRIPAIFGNSFTGSDDLFPVAIEVTVGPPSIGLNRNDTLILSAIIGAVKRWSTIAYYSVTQSLRDSCERWCREQPPGIGREILARLPACPRRLDQALAQNSGFKEDRGLARSLSRMFFHRGAETCFRQTTFEE